MVKILLVDDDEDLLTVLSHALSANGYEVTKISRPELLLETINTRKPDIIILDINMGKWDGRDLCAGIKKDAAYRHIPVVLFSGNDNYENENNNCNPDLFVQKPVSTSLFLQKLGDLLRSKEK